MTLKPEQQENGKRGLRWQPWGGMLYKGSQHVRWSSAVPSGAALTMPEGDDEKKQAVKTESLNASKMYSTAQQNQQRK